MKKDALYWAERAERGIYWAVGALLVVVAVVFLVFIIFKGVPLYFRGEFATATIKLFDQALLTLMIAQVVYTTVAFLEGGCAPGGTDPRGGHHRIRATRPGDDGGGVRYRGKCGRQPDLQAEHGGDRPPLRHRAHPGHRHLSGP